MLASSTTPPTGGDHLKETAMHKSLSAIGVLALVFALIAPIAVHAEIVSVPSAAPSEPAATLPPPTVLRGSRPAPAQPACPPGYTLSQDYPDYGCIAASGGGYAEGSQGYDYWPDYGWGDPFFGLPAFGAGSGRFHHTAGFRGLPGQTGFHGRAGFHSPAGFHGRSGFHSPAGFHAQARFGGFAGGAGHMGGFGHR
jgi:hypothetical protein